MNHALLQDARAQDVMQVVGTLLNVGARSATKFISSDFVIRAAIGFKPRKNSRSVTIHLTLGKPNYEGRQFVERCLKAGEPFPVKKVQLKFFPPKKRSKR